MKLLLILLLSVTALEASQEEKPTHNLTITDPATFLTGYNFWDTPAGQAFWQTPEGKAAVKAMENYQLKHDHHDYNH